MGNPDDRDLNALRERLAIRVSRHAFLLGVVPLGILWWESARALTPSFLPLTLSLTLAALAALAFVPVSPMSRRWRVPLILAALSTLPILSPMVNGFLSGAMGGAAATCLLGACLAGRPVAWAITAALVAWLLAIGALHTTGVLSVNPVVMDLGQWLNWVRTGFALALLMGVPVLAMVEHLENLTRTTRRQRELLDAAVKEENKRLRSVEDRARAETERRGAQGLLALGRLGGGFAHDCSNQLQAIRGELDLLGLGSARASSSAIVKQGLSDMAEAVDAAGAVLRRLLALGGREIASTAVPIDVGAFVRTAQRQLRMLDRLKVVAEVEDCPPALGDTSSLHGALLNLALNARDAMAPDGTLRIRARAATRQERDETGCVSAIDVADSGLGMDATTMKRIFEPFFTTKGAAGTGLGLGAAKRVLEAVGGRLRVTSTPGQGTTVTLLLAEAAGVSPPREERLPSTEVVTGAFVLVVDDDPAVRSAWRSGLAIHGFRVLEAQSVDEAIPIVQKTPIALAWMDAVMPGRPTRDLIEELKRLQPHAHLVVCSGHVEEELLRRDLRTGEVDFVAKPCALSVLLDRAGRAAAAAVARAGR